MAKLCEKKLIHKPLFGFEIDNTQIIPRIEKGLPNAVNLQTRLTKNLYMDIPFIPSPMDSVMNVQMAVKLIAIGGIPIIYINCKDLNAGVNDFVEVCNMAKDVKKIGISIASGIENIKKLDAIIDEVDVIAIDSLHSNPVQMLDTISYIKSHYPQIDVISGNVTNGYDAKEVIMRGADAFMLVNIGFNVPWSLRSENTPTPVMYSASTPI